MKKILLIEDDDALRENVKEILQLANYWVAEASDGKDGIEKALKIKPDLILCDISMPDLDGYGVLKVLGTHPETLSIPFIFLTAHSDLTDLRKGMALGADDYLTKPLNEADLLNAIDFRLKKAEELGIGITPDLEAMSGFIQQVRQSDNFTEGAAGKEINRYTKKHVLYSAGQRPANVYFVVNGKLKGYHTNNEGKELITNIYTRGDFIGYIDILEELSYSESVQVLDDSELMLIPKEDFIHLLNTDGQVAKRFITLLSLNARIKEEKLINMAYNSLRKKVAVGIVELMDKFKDRKNGKPVVEISREDLAGIVGSAQESLIRTLKEFKSEKLIEVADGGIYVLDENSLRHLTH